MPDAKRDRLIQLKEAAHIVGIDPHSLLRLLRAERVRVEPNATQQDCVRASELRRLVESDAAKQAAHRAMANEAIQRREDKDSGAEGRFLSENADAISLYRKYIAELETIHRSYLARIRPLDGKTPIKAAYLLFAQAINLLHLGCLCLENGRQNAGFVLRQVDEVVQLALYFTLCGSESDTQENLCKWYYENRSPSPAEMRRAVARNLPAQSAPVADQFLKNITDVYDWKSKWVHPAHTAIREIFYTDPEASSSEIESFDYQSCTYPRRLLKLTRFFESSVWTVVQHFLLCFLSNNMLTEQDLSRLMKINTEFEARANGQ